VVSLDLPIRKTRGPEDPTTIVLGDGPEGGLLSPFNLFRRYRDLLKQETETVKWRGEKNKLPKYFFPNWNFPQKNLKTKSISNIFKVQVQKIGMNPKLYGSHSGRIGGATMAFKLGLPPAWIKDHGGWKSTAVYGYFNDPIYTNLAVSEALLNGKLPSPGPEHA
jgi:hypothetical protein